MVIMTNRLSDDVDALLVHLQQTLEFTNNVKAKCKQAEEEKDSTRAELAELRDKYEQLRVTKSSCKKCRVLMQQLMQERKLAKEAQARLKSVASLLNFDDASQRNQLTEAQYALVSQMLEVNDESDSFGDQNESGGGTNGSNEIQRTKRSFSLLSGKSSIKDGSDSDILVPETVPYEISEDIKNVITIPETQAEENILKTAKLHKTVEDQAKLHESNVQDQNSDPSSQLIKLIENRAEKIRAARMNRSIYINTEEDEVNRNEMTPERIQSDTTRQPDGNKVIDNKELVENQVLKRISPENRLSLKSSRSISQKRDSDDNEKPSKENADSSSSSSDSSLCLQGVYKYQRIPDKTERAATFWKLKASHIIEPGVTNSGDAQRKKKKLTQMKLSVSSFNSRHDVSSFANFNGGVASVSVKEEDENDIILPSPNKIRHKKFRKQQTVKNSRTENSENTTLTPSLTSGCKPLSKDSGSDRQDVMKDITTQDLDETLFNPAVTSTCIPTTVGTSFDRIPEVSKSPPYKYRRDAVRKKDERMKLPGQQCNDCALFYEIAGYSKEDRQKAMNACSKHRDKFPILYNSPPDFWNPVLPDSPE